MKCQRLQIILSILTILLSRLILVVVAVVPLWFFFQE